MSLLRRPLIRHRRPTTLAASLDTPTALALSTASAGVAAGAWEHLS